MSTVTLTLINPRYAPWGLLTDEEKPQMIVWLTEETPSQEVEKILLSDWDVVRIKQAENAQIISVIGLDDVGLINEEDETEEVEPCVPIAASKTPAVADSQTIMDVTQLMRKEAEKAKALEEKIKGRYPKIDELLAEPAYKLKKELKELAKGRTLVSFFQEARKKEIEGKDRKTVVSVLTDIIQAKIAAVGMDGYTNGTTGQTSLSDAYYDMIEEFEDEDEEEDVISSDHSTFSENLPS